MYNLLKTLTVAIALFFAVLFCAYADDSADNILYSGDGFAYSDVKVFARWLIGCDNLEECSAIGLSQTPPETPDDTWYISAKWHKGSDDINFSVSFFWRTGDSKEKKYLANLSFQLCADSKQCRPITAQDELQISTQTNEQFVSKKLKFTLNMKGLTDKSYLIFNEYKDSPVYFKDFLQNRNAITIYPFSELGGKEKVYKTKAVDTNIGAAKIKKIYPQYNVGMDNYDIKNEQNCLLPNYAVEYENGDKFIFACSNEGFNTEVGKYNGKIYQNFNVVDAATFGITGRGMAWDNLFGDTFFYENNHNTFEVSRKSRSLGSFCGVVYNFAYNGKKFIIETIRYMPICIDLPMEDWPVIYRRPS